MLQDWSCITRVILQDSQEWLCMFAGRSKRVSGGNATITRGLCVGYLYKIIENQDLQARSSLLYPLSFDVPL